MKNKHYRNRFRELGNTPEYVEPLIDVSYDLINAAEMVSQAGVAETYNFNESQLPKFQTGEVTTVRWIDNEFALATNFVHNALIVAIRQRGVGETAVVQPGKASFYRDNSVRLGREEHLSKEYTRETMKHLHKAMGHFGIYNLLDLTQRLELAA